MNDQVRALAWGPDGALYVGGLFSQAGGVWGVGRLARWTPSSETAGTWSALQTGVTSSVFSLAWGPDGALYVGGAFPGVGDISGTSRIARWTPDGAGSGAWSALGVGVNQQVFTLAWGNNSILYVGGQFTSAGGATSANFARWQGSPPVSTEPGGPHAGYALEAIYPNPFRSATTIAYVVAEAGAVTIEVYDTLGRRVAALVNGEVTPGRHQAHFDAARLASGVYFVRMSGRDFSDTRRVSVMR
ncbi:hypothetical protein BH23BAC4_BH23BAC4_14070 [soil metagenome]